MRAVNTRPGGPTTVGASPEVAPSPELLPARGASAYPPRMSDLGGYPSRPDLPPEPGRGQDIPGWVIGVAVAVVLAMTGALAFAVLGSGGSHEPAAAPSRSPSPSASRSSHPAPSYPKQWDKRIRPEVRLAQDARLLRFKHPVPVRFLPSAAFTRALLKDDQTSAYQTQQLEHAGDLLRSFGLLDDSVDVVAATDQFSGAAVLAYYSPATASITVRGTRITPSVKATLVHELTHALQDQYFHFGAREQELSAQHQAAADAEVSMLHSLAEGDAQRAEHDYEATLSPAQLSALAVAQQREFERAQPGMASVPQILTALGTPYDIAEGLVTAVTDYGGDSAVAHLFRRPPQSDVVLVDPFRLWEHRSTPAAVPVPTLRPGEKQVASGQLGALAWYFVLSARLDPTQALRTVDGWDGDSYVEYQTAGRTCVRADYRARTPHDAAAMDGALGRWKQAATASSASVRRVGALGVVVETCDPGTAVSGLNDLGPAVGLVVTRTALGLQLMQTGLPPDVSRCIAGGIVQTYTLAELTDPSFAQSHPAAPATVQRIEARCE